MIFFVRPDEGWKEAQAGRMKTQLSRASTPARYACASPGGRFVYFRRFAGAVFAAWGGADTKVKKAPRAFVRAVGFGKAMFLLINQVSATWKPIDAQACELLLAFVSSLTRIDIDFVRLVRTMV